MSENTVVTVVVLLTLVFAFPIFKAMFSHIIRPVATLLLRLLVTASRDAAGFYAWFAGDRAEMVTLDRLDRAGDAEFDRLIAEVFKQRGYRARLTNATQDAAAAILATKEEHTYAVRPQRNDRPIDEAAIGQAVGDLARHNCDTAMVVTNNYFSDDAKKLAESGHCTLVDRDLLALWLKGGKKTGRAREQIENEE